MQAVYFAPRGKKRLLVLGHNLAQRYLSPEDNLIGFIGEAGAGKSLLIRGMFPGLELTNDDDGINVRPLPLIGDAERGHFRTHTYHLDAR
ncbi:MAG TPA: alanine-tRNA synthetase second additional domain-containing protein, partial [Verrucomicrobiae bacterium]|nr:alanine-tRNA synthetase second additional domain-containing protein [Verrucomicrobiae bacterium]